jgi:hypothetical protein
MYTVIISAKKTSDNMQEHYPALRNVVESNQIGLCQWIKSGTNIEMALPELYDLIGSNREWRAIVAMYDETDESTEDNVNPYDYEKRDKTYDDNKGVGFTLEESNDIDLIRLTHLLAGAPLPSPEFEPEEYPKEVEDGFVPYIPYIKYNMNREVYDKKCLEYNKWNTEHKINGILPSEIILVRTRDVTYRDDSEIIKQAWENHSEADSSNFRERNLYPQCCKFLVYDIEKRGMMYEERDALRYWISLLTLAINSVDSNILQPHKLYNLSVNIDNDSMRDIFQDTAKKLNMARRKLMKSIAPSDGRIYDIDDIPNYKVDVPVNFHQVKLSNGYQRSDFNVDFAGGVTTNEEVRWDKYTVDTYLRTKEIIKSADRELELAALSFRDRCEYSEDEVQIIDKFAEEDLKNSIHDTYEKILSDQKKLPKGVLTYEEEMKEADQQVKKDILERMSQKQISLALFGTIGVMIATLIPAFWQDSSQTETIIYIFVTAIIIGAVAFAIVFLQRRKFKAHVEEFQNYFDLMGSEMSKNARLYTEFLGDIASHIHGASYLRKVAKQKEEASNAISIKKSHVSFIEEFKNRLALWSSALRLSVDMEAIDEIEFALDYSAIDFDRLYSISYGDSYRSIPLNDSGYTMRSPFGFVTKLNINREEVYDNVR